MLVRLRGSLFRSYWNSFKDIFFWKYLYLSCKICTLIIRELCCERTSNKTHDFLYNFTMKTWQYSCLTVVCTDHIMFCLAIFNLINYEQDRKYKSMSVTLGVFDRHNLVCTQFILLCKCEKLTSVAHAHQNACRPLIREQSSNRETRLLLPAWLCR